MKKQNLIAAPEIPDLTEGSLSEAYNWCLSTAEERTEWYRKRSRNFRGWSKYLRIFTLILAALGILAPLYESILNAGGREMPAFLPPGINLVELGYLSLAFGGVLYLFDKAFGLSRGWIRFMTTLIRLQNRIRIFQMEWIGVLAEKPEGPARVSLMHGFISDINKITETETIQWAAEFENSLALLESLAKIPARK